MDGFGSLLIDLILAPAIKNSLSKTWRPASEENGWMRSVLGCRGSKGNFVGNAM